MKGIIPNNIKSSLLTFLLMCIASLTSAQEIKVVKDLTARQTDVYARTHQVYVGEGDDKQLCAAIKVALVLPEVKFGGSFFKQQSGGTNGEYIVYVAPGCKKLKVMTSSFLPMEYAFPFPVEAGVTYEMTIGIPESSESLLRLKVNVKDAKMQINGKEYVTENANFEIRIPKGQYDYTISTDSPGFTAVSGKINIDDIFHTQKIDLPTIKRYKLTINADANSRIVLDGTTQTERGSQTLTVSAGLHQVEAYMGVDERWSKSLTVDMTNDNAMVDMHMRGNLRIVYPTGSEFELTPLNNALPSAKKTIKSGEQISLLGDYAIKAKKKYYVDSYANVTIAPNANIDNFKIEVTSNGDNYFYGINGVQQDYEKAFKQYKKMAKRDDDIAQYKLALCYDKGYGTEKNMDEARIYYKKASDAGHGDATYELASITTDSELRLEYYQKAAQQGNIMSMKIVGDYFIHQKNYPSALEYYSMAIKDVISQKETSISHIQGDCLAAIGEIYYFGWGTKRDLDMAQEYYTRAATIDNALANERLIDYTYYGYKGIPDKPLAIKHYKELGDSLSDEGALKVALFEYNNMDYSEANRYFTKIMNSEIALPDDIGEIFYMMGDKVYREDVPAAFYYYSTSEKMGVVKTKQMVRLGYMYMNGKGTAVNYDLSKQAFEKASVLNDPEGTSMLGYMYEKGRGVSAVDIDMAKELYTKAGKSGYMKAYNNLGTLYARQRDMDKAVYYWELAGKAKVKGAIKNLITYYSKRNNTEKVNYWKKLQR